MPQVDLFTKLTSVEEAMEALLSIIKPIGRSSSVGLENADNRILTRDVFAPRDFPHYDMGHMDGYAVRAEDTAGSGPGSPVLLKLSGVDRVSHGTCRWSHTGGALPEGADAVVRVEDTEEKENGVLIFHEVIKGENITPHGKTVRKGDLLYKKGMQLKPTSIAMLATLGFTEIEIYEKPKVLVIPTGDELIEQGKEAGPGNINESNGLMCYLLVRRYGGKAQVLSIVPDNVEMLAASLKRGLKYDLIVTSGGSSVGIRDHMREVISSMGKVLVHGVGLKPGRPMGFGYIEEGDVRVPIIFLPGFPDACAAGTMMFVDKAIKKLGHYPPGKYYSCEAVTTERIKSFPGTTAIAKVAVEGGKATPVGIIGPYPYDGESAYVIIPDDTGGLDAGKETRPVFLE